MPGQKGISSEQLDKFRERLHVQRDRLMNQVDQGVEAIRSELNPAGNLSNVPVHLADAASGQVDADISIVESERDMLQHIQSALQRIDQGTYGRCLDCGSSIPPARLNQIPYAAYCIACTDAHSVGPARVNHRRGGTLKLTGFDAIEFAEKEGFTLNKLSDSIDDAAEDLTIAEAQAIASDNPDLIWLEIASEDYGVRKNMRPGR